VSGSNGSGKTTLMDALLGMRENYDHWDPESVHALRAELGTQIRLIERDPEIYPDLVQLDAQIFGNPNALDDYSKLDAQIIQALGTELGSQWIRRIHSLREQWEQRSDQTLSSGEKTILSFARCFSHWSDQVRLLVLDESDSALDSDMRALLKSTLEKLSKKIAVYQIKHEDQSPVLKPSWSTHVYILGVDSVGKGHPLPMYVQAKPSGTGKIQTTGRIGSELEDCFRVARTALIHTYPELTGIERWDLSIDCDSPAFKAAGVRSAGLAAAVALMNLVQISEGRSPLQNCAASGNVLLDGTVENVSGADAKRSATEEAKGITHVLLPREIKPLLNLKAVYSA